VHVSTDGERGDGGERAGGAGGTAEPVPADVDREVPVRLDRRATSGEGFAGDRDPEPGEDGGAGAR
jgi:hypothetical protein